jgi:hypothetical protein
MLANLLLHSILVLFPLFFPLFLSLLLSSLRNLRHGVDAPAADTFSS